MSWYSRIRSAFKDNWRKILETINVVSWPQEDFNSSILVMEVEVISPVDGCWESLSIQAAELSLLDMWCSLHSVRRRSRLGLLVLPSTSAMAKSQWSITRYFFQSPKNTRLMPITRSVEKCREISKWNASETPVITDVVVLEPELSFHKDRFWNFEIVWATCPTKILCNTDKVMILAAPESLSSSWHNFGSNVYFQCWVRFLTLRWDQFWNFGPV